MPTPAELRERSRFYRRMAGKETEPHLKRHLAAHALALAQLAEKIERDDASAQERRPPDPHNNRHRSGASRVRDWSM